MIQPALASSYREKLQTLALEEHLAEDPAWQRLLHDRRNLFGIYQSEIDDPSFFLSPNGRRDPSVELEATLDAFFKPAPVDAQAQQAQCRYPARYAWLKEKLHFDSAQLPEQDCPRFAKWKSQMNPESISLVFASYYMNNPASTYGHTFLRLNRKTHSSNEHLLDYVVNFAADLAQDNGFLFAVKGLLGGYHGRFSTLPYYMKVQEYNNLESRDLWEYDLNVTPAQVDRLLAHLWELGNTRLPYYFFNKNCSYYLLPVLEVMDPSLSVSRRFVMRAIPIDTLRQVIQTPGMRGETHYRPSHATRMVASRQCLTAPEIELVEKAAREPAVIGEADLRPYTPVRQAQILDSAYDLFRFQAGFRPDLPDAIQEKENRLLLLRNHVGVPSPPLEFSTATLVSPDQGHASGRIGLAYGVSNRSHFEELSARPAIHDQDDPARGYLPGSQLEMLNTRLRYDNDRKTLYPQEISLVDLFSLTPWDRWIHPLSWKISTGLLVAEDLNRDPENSLMYGLNLGSGYAAWLPGSEKILFYGMAQADTQLSHAFDHDVRFGGGPCGGVLIMPSTFWRGRFEMSQDFYAAGGTPSTTKLHLVQSISLTKFMELHVSLERQNIYKEALFSWVLYL